MLESLLRPEFEQKFAHFIGPLFGDPTLAGAKSQFPELFSKL